MTRLVALLCLLFGSTFAADFLVTTDSTNPENTSQHFVVRILDESVIAVARAEISKTEGFQIISGIIDPTPVDYNPSWSFHLKPETIFFAEVFIEVCDANVLYVEENLDQVGGAFLPNSQWCPWGSRVLLELDSAPSQSPVSVPTIGSDPPVSAVDFLVTSDRSDPENTAQHYVVRIMDEATISEARAELNKTDMFKIVSGIIDPTPVDWNPGWSFHVIPETVLLAEFFTEVCDASVEYVQEHLGEIGTHFLPNNQWCPWGSRILRELRVNATIPPVASPIDAPTIAPWVSPTYLPLPPIPGIPVFIDDPNGTSPVTLQPTQSSSKITATTAPLAPGALLTDTPVPATLPPPTIAPSAKASPTESPRSSSPEPPSSEEPTESPRSASLLSSAAFQRPKSCSSVLAVLACLTFLFHS